MRKGIVRFFKGKYDFDQTNSPFKKQIFQRFCHNFKGGYLYLKNIYLKDSVKGAILVVILYSNNNNNRILRFIQYNNKFVVRVI